MLAIPKGANPPGICGSRNFPLRALFCVKVPSNTSTVAQRKLVAYRNTPAVFVPAASPLYTEPLAQRLFELSTLSSAIVPGPGNPSPRFQAEIVPSSVAKMKSAGLESFKLKANELFATIPVGADGGVPPLGGGIVTARAGSAPAKPDPSPWYKADIPEPLALIQNGPPGKNAFPHGFNN